jgi:drug/metabolite transporter (DMT)-like permease
LNSKAIPYVILLGTLFGATLVVSRFSVGQFAPTTYIGLRFTLASLGFLVVYTLNLGGRTWPRNRAMWGRSILIGIFGTAIPMTGIVSSLQYLSSGLSSILITVNPAITVLLAHFFLDDEHLTLRKGSGVLLALGGAVLLVILGETGLPDVGQANPLGYILVTVGMISGSISTIYVRKNMPDDNPFDVTGIRMFTAALVMVPVAVLIDGFDLSQVNGQGIAALIFAALVGTFTGFLLSFYNIQRFGATAAVMTSYVVPVVAGLIGVLFLQEQITWGMFIGIAFIILGVLQINRRPPNYGDLPVSGAD